MRILIPLSILPLAVACAEPASSRPEAEARAGAEPFIVRCEEPLPEFTLGRSSSPNDQQVAELCACIFNGLSGPARDAAVEADRANREGVNPDIDIDPLINEFDGAIRQCGGYSL